MRVSVISNNEMSSIDITEPESVQVDIKSDGKVIWVNVNGSCMFRACRIKNLEINDGRKHNGEEVKTE